LAGFQVTLIGRFWVTPEAAEKVFEDLGRNLQRSIADPGTRNRLFYLATTLEKKLEKKYSEKKNLKRSIVVRF